MPEFEFDPQNDFEKTLLAAQTGNIPMREMLRQLVETNFYVGVLGDATENEPFELMVFQREGVSRVAAFSSIDYLNQYSENAPYSMMMKGSELLERIPDRLGFVLNPGQQVGFEIDPTDLKRIRDEFCQ